MENYYELLEDILSTGEHRGDRTGTGTQAVFGRLMRFDLNKGFPLLTGKRVPFRSVVAELLCFLNAKHMVQDFQAENCSIWDEWALEDDYHEVVHQRRSPGSLVLELAAKLQISYREAAGKLEEADNAYLADSTQPNAEQVLIDHGIAVDDEVKRLVAAKGELGPIYGVQWRNWEAVGPRGAIVTVDQIFDTVKLLKDFPNTRRAVVTAWNPAVIPDEGSKHADNVKAGKQALPPCHYAFQAWISKPGTPEAKLSLMYIMRSNDVFLGMPFNIASYALLTHLLANELGIGVGELIAVTGDTHIYSNHMEQVELLSSRNREHDLPALPKLELDPSITLTTMTVDSIVASLKDYNPLGTIKAPVAV